MIDGCNSAEVFLSNMDYAQVAAAVVTQEYIDGIQNDYLQQVAEKYPDRFLVCGMCEFRKPGYLEQAQELVRRNFKAIKIPAQRLLLPEGRVSLVSDEMINMFHLMEDNRMILSIDLADGDLQVGEMEEIISECPHLKIAIGHFGMVTRPDWLKQIRLARHPNVFIESVASPGSLTMNSIRSKELCEPYGKRQMKWDLPNLCGDRTIRALSLPSLTVCHTISLSNRTN